MKSTMPNPGPKNARKLTNTELKLTGLPVGTYVSVNFQGKIAFLQQDPSMGLSPITGLENLSSDSRLDLEGAAEKLVEAWGE